MERDLAVRLLAAVHAMSPALNEATDVTNLMQDQYEAKILRRHLGSVMAGPLFELVMHVVRQYPDLDPDK